MPTRLPSGFEATSLPGELVHLRAPTPEHPTPMQCALVEREVVEVLGLRVRVPHAWSRASSRPFVYVRVESAPPGG